MGVMAKNQITSYPHSRVSAQGRGETMRALSFRTRSARWEDEEEKRWVLHFRRE